MRICEICGRQKCFSAMGYHVTGTITWFCEVHGLPEVEEVA